MVVTRGKKKSSSSATTLEEQNKAAENGLPDTHSDSLTVDVIEPNEDAQLEDKLDLFSDNARKENFGEVPGEEGKKVTEVDNEDPSMSVTETNGDNKAELGENTFEDDEIDDQKDMLWEDDKEAFEHDSEDRVLDMYELNEEEAAYEDDEGDDVSEEEATEEDEASEEEATKEENDKENYQEKKENAEQDKRVAKVKEDGRKAKVKEDGREAKVKEDGREAKVHEDGREAKVKEDGREANKHESEASLKNIKNSNKRRRKKKLQTGGLMKVDSEDKPESSRKRKVKNRVQSMGMIFMCSSETKKDCYKYRVFGLPESKKDIVEKIYTGMRLFLYDFDLKLMYGIYKATGPGGYNIEPKAFKSQFPSQVRFKVKENCLPLPEEKFKKIIEENYFTKTKFDCQLNSEQVKKLCRLFSASSKGRPSKKLGMSLKAEKRPIHRERGRRQRTGDKRHLPLREEARCPERPRKSPRKAMSPAAPPRERFPPPLPSTIPSSYVYDRASDMDAYRQPRKRQRKAMSPAAPPRERFPPPLPSKIPSSYVYDRASDMDAYRRDPYLERRSPYRDRRDRPLIPVDPYGGVRAPPIEHSDRYRDGRDPPLEHHYAYSGGRDSHIERRDHYIDGVDSYSRRRDPYSDGREPHVEPRDPYRDGRDPYIESRESYRDGRHPYVERRDSFRDLRAPYLERHVPYGDSAHSELYSSYRRPPLSDSRVEFCDSYRRDEPSGRHDQHQLHSDIMKHHVIAGRDAFVSSRERPSYADTLYPAAYPSRAGLYGL